MVSDKQLEEIITVVEENLDYEDRCRSSDNCEMYGYISSNDKEKVKKWIKEILDED